MYEDLIINSELYLTNSTNEDKNSLIEYLNDDELYNQTLRVPKPYTEQDAEFWFEYIFSFEKENGKRKNWVIKNNQHQLIGHIGLHFPYGIENDVVEVYYWLGKPFRNRGVMTKVLTFFSDYCLEVLNYKRIEAPIFDYNEASGKILLKSGFVFEQDLPEHYVKNEKKINAKMYYKIRN